MQRNLFIKLLFFLCIYNLTLKAHSVNASFVEVNFNDLQKMIDKQDDTLRIFNFWATWCAPCVKELPLLIAIEKNYVQIPIKFIFVSLDFSNNVHTILAEFIPKHMNPMSMVLWLHDLDMNAWIPKVDSDWSGAIPVTLFVKNKKRIFVPNEFTTQTEITNIILNF